jgi:hypothetical protein
VNLDFFHIFEQLGRTLRAAQCRKSTTKKSILAIIFIMPVTRCMVNTSYKSRNEHEP